MATASTNAPVPVQNFSELQRGKRNKIPSSVLLLQMCREKEEVKQIHGQLIVNGLIHRFPNAAKLVESYVGVSETDDALDVVTWGVIISCFATHGQAKLCFQLFDEMIESGVEPNGVVFVALLSACSHAGLVEQGCHYFDQMVHQFRIKPSIEHFGCMVDLLGRAGRLAEAEQLILSMPEEPNSVILGALFNACRIHNDVERGRPLFKRLISLEPSPDRYKLAASLFANNGDDYEIRKLLKDKILETRCGLSNIQVDGVDHEFMVSDIVNDRAQDVYETLRG